MADAWDQEHRARQDERSRREWGGLLKTYGSAPERLSRRSTSASITQCSLVIGQLN